MGWWLSLRIWKYSSWCVLLSSLFAWLWCAYTLGFSFFQVLVIHIPHQRFVGFIERLWHVWSQLFVVVFAYLSVNKYKLRIYIIQMELIS